MAIAGSQPLRIAAAVNLASNRAGNGGAVCALSGGQLSIRALAAGGFYFQQSSESVDSCLSGIEPFAELLSAKSPFMISFLTGAHLTVPA